MVIQRVPGRTREIAAKCVLPRYRPYCGRGLNPEDLVVAVKEISRKIANEIGKYLTVERWTDLDTDSETIVGILEVVEPVTKWFDQRELLE